MKQKLTGIDYIDRYNYQRGLTEYLPEDKDGINNLLMTHRKIYEEYKKREQERIEKEKIVIDKKELKAFEEEVAEDLVKEIEKLLI